jgi:hypothetical protein
MKNPRDMTEEEYRQWRIEETRKRAKLIREGKLRADQLSDEVLSRWAEWAKRDDWHYEFVGSDIRLLIGEVQRTRAALAKLDTTEKRDGK